MLRERLARVVLPAPVEAITLDDRGNRPLAGRNLGLLPGDEAAATVPLLDRLRARLGEAAVTLVTPHRRASARARVARNEDRARKGNRIRGCTEQPGKKEIAGACRFRPPFPFPPRHRPVWLLAEPEPLGHRLEAQPWVLRDGPERIESGWWDGADVRRDYFIAENPRGETVWIYRDHRYGTDDGEWFVHGLFA